MNFQVISLFPDLIRAGVQSGVVGQAVQKGQVKVDVIQPRDYANDAHRSVDDRPFGGGDGMIMLPEILEATVAKARESGPTRVIYLSPQGPVLTDAKARMLSTETSVTLVCGRYAGIDQRALNACVDEELSIGDYVLSGGEFAALVVIDAVSRLLPGVLGHQESAHNDSFSNGILEHPSFTRPREWRGVGVPADLLSGNHARIELWKAQLSILVTARKRPELLTLVPRKSLQGALAAWENMSPSEREACGLEDLDPKTLKSRP